MVTIPAAPDSFIARLVAVKFTPCCGKLPLPGGLAQARKRLDLKRVDSKPAAETELEAVQALRGDRERPVLIRGPDFNVCDRIPVEVAEHVVREHVEKGMTGSRLDSECGRAGWKQDAAWRLAFAEHGLRRPIQGLWQSPAVSIQHSKADIAVDPAPSRACVAHLKRVLNTPGGSTAGDEGEFQLGGVAARRSGRDRQSRINRRRRSSRRAR